MKHHKKFGVISFDFWPLSDWWRLSKHTSQCSLQICVGPWRLDWDCM